MILNSYLFFKKQLYIWKTCDNIQIEHMFASKKGMKRGKADLYWLKSDPDALFGV